MADTDIQLVRFGERPNEVVPLDTAERMLMLFKARDPRKFGALLAETLTGVRYSASKTQATQ